MPPLRPHRRASLHIECLEDRSLPSSTPVLAETFQTSSASGLPSGWVQWSANGSSAFKVDLTGGLGDSGELAAAAPSGIAGRTWVSGTSLTDVEASAAVLLNSLNPATVFVRGRSLDTATPTYYAVSITRGLTVELSRVVAGKATGLGTARSADYVSGQWVQVALRVAGSVLTVQVRRTDTGRYLSSAGEWVSQPVNAVAVSDTAIASAGQVGLARGSTGADRLLFDSVRVHAVTPETRELLQAERFDADTPGKLPDGWTQWSNRPEGTAAVGKDQTLVLAGISPSATRAWLTRALPADVQVSTSAFVDSMVPAQLYLRGSNLGTATPTYYSVSVVRGLTVRLTRTVNGVETVLGTISSRDYVSGQWIQVSLVAKGNELRVQLFRTDTSQYLKADGTWGLSPDWALARTDTAIASGGLTGIGRAAGFAGNLSFDNFLVSSPPARWDEGNPIPTAGDKPTGNPTPPTDTGGGTTTPPPAGGGTTTPPIAPGTLPTVDRNLSWIRLAQLAYSGTPMTDYEKNLLRNYIDLVIPNPAYLSTIAQASPTTPQFLYTNLSNIYLSLLTDWLAWADARGVDRESAFYHVSKATAYTGSSPSSVPVDWFWGVHASNGGAWTDLTSAARQSTGTVAAPGAGGTLAVGYTDKFREIVLTAKTIASGGWTGTLEYVSAVDSLGRPTAWSTLAVLRDGTVGFQRSGTITFDPPANWKAASVNGSARLFYVRVRTTSAGGTGAVFSSVRTTDYLNARGTNSGTVPAFDSSADLNKDGYLSDAEYAKRKTGMDARFAYQSRVLYPVYGPNRFATNVSNASFRAWAVDYTKRTVLAQPLAAGLFVDNSVGRLVVDPAGVKESLTTYSADYGTLLKTVDTSLRASGKWLVANTVGGGTSPNEVVKAGVSTLEEFALRPLAANYVQFEDLAAMLAARRILSGGKSYEILDSLPTNGDPTDPRTQLATLAMYYLLADPNTSFLMMNGGAEPSSSWTRHFTGAINYNVGKPTGSYTIFAAGKDPSNTALDYKVYARSYANALVLYKPLSYTKGTTGTLANNTATTHVLGGTYRVVNADGTLGPPVTRITLRNGEGVVLARA